MLRERTLLLADDSIAIQKVVELTFMDEGMQVVSVGDGRQAIERLEEVQPDIVLADIFMPELNGYQVCERIRGNARFRQIPVILLVGSFEPFNEAEARRVGADDYLTKPFQSIRQMVSKVGSLLSGKKSREEQDTEPLPQRTAGPESQASAEELELMTADTAPLPPHAQRTASPEKSGAPQKKPLTDLQLDDEMIEETPAQEFGAAGRNAGRTSGATESPAVPDYAAAATQTAAAPAPTAERVPTRAASSDDVLLDLDEVELPRSSAMAEADDFILDLQDAGTAPSPVAHTPQAAEFAEAQIVGTESQAEPATAAESQAPIEESFTYTPGMPPVVIDEAPAEQSAASPQEERFPEPSTAQLAPTEELPGSYQTETAPAAQAEAAAAAPAAETAAAPTGHIGLDQLSPEAIDAIARRVVEQLSTKVVEQIAWEVVPPLAELLIKRRLEEKE